MTAENIRDSLKAAIGFLTENPEFARIKNPPATAVLEGGLKFRVEGPKGEVITTDMPPEVGGEGSATSPGWYVKVALATCDATVIAMKAAREGIELNTLEVTVNYDSDARGTLGIDSSIHPGPMDMTVTVRLGAGGVPEEKLRKIVKWAEAHSPVADTICRAISYTTEVEIV
jgi:uncharacterized OsmC-like protein